MKSAISKSEVFSTFNVSLLLMDSEAISGTSVRQEITFENSSRVGGTTVMCPKF